LRLTFDKRQAEERSRCFFYNGKSSVEKVMDHERKSCQTSNPPEARYANYFKIGHNAFELIIDCGQCYAENEEPQLHTRIITSPAFGKELLRTLRQSLDEYEKSYKQIRE